MGTINSLLCHCSLICFCCQSFLSLLKLMFPPLQDSSSSMKDLSETSILLNMELDIVPWQFPITHFTSSFTPPPRCFHSCPRQWRAWFNDALGFGSNPVRENATLTFGKDGNLVLADADGRLAWQTNTASKGVVGLKLLSNGNMVLHDRFWLCCRYPSSSAWTCSKTRE